MADDRRRAVVAGHTGDRATAVDLAGHSDARVVTVALGALARIDALDPDRLGAALRDDRAAVRRRACEIAATVPGGSLVDRLSDDDDTVVEVAAWALGERRPPEQGACAALTAIATGHGDHLCREAAVAALGALGDPSGLPAVLGGLDDRATVRRRAVLALAAFDGPEVEAALERARGDRDRQVRQAAEDLT